MWISKWCRKTGACYKSKLEIYVDQSDIEVILVKIGSYIYFMHFVALSHFGEDEDASCQIFNNDSMLMR